MKKKGRKLTRGRVGGGGGRSDGEGEGKVDGGGVEIGSKSNDKKGTSKKDRTKRIRMGRQCEHTAGGREAERVRG